MVYKSGGRLRFRFVDSATILLSKTEKLVVMMKVENLAQINVKFSDEIRRFADLRKVIYGVSKYNHQYSLLKPSVGEKSSY